MAYEDINRSELMLPTSDGAKKTYVETSADQVVMKSGRSVESALGDMYVNVKDFGAVDGNDNTQAINNAIEYAHSQGAGTVLVPSGTHLVNLDSGGNGIILKNGVTLHFSDDAWLHLTPTARSNYNIIKAHNVTNVTINNARVHGDKTTHLATNGEWGMGISIQDANNITINNPHVTDCWGDGIYVGERNGRIEINNPVCDNNRRQGISVISGDHVVINNPICKNTSGTSPSAGIDVEPNLGSVMRKVTINNPYTENNQGAGIIVGVNKLADTGKFVDITINKHTDKGSGSGARVAASRAVKGTISFIEPTWSDSKGTAFLVRDYHNTAPVLTIRNSTIIDPHRETDATSLTSPKYGSVVTFLREASDVSDGYLGNVTIDGLYISCDGVTPYANVAIFDEFLKLDDSIKIINLRRLANTTVPLSTRADQGVVEIGGYTDYTELNSHGTTNALTIARNYKNTNQTARRDITLADNTNVGVVLNVKVDSNAQIHIIPTNQVILTETTVGEKLTSNTKGSSISLKKISTTEWSVLNKIGTWTKTTI